MSVRQRWVYTEGGQPLDEPYEVGSDWTGAERRAQTATEELVYGKVGNVAAGYTIDSRRKFKEYMRREGVAHASDYSAEHYAKKQSERQQARTPGSGYDGARRKEAIHRAVQRLRGEGKIR